jgi:hypothetical protein
MTVQLHIPLCLPDYGSEQNETSRKQHNINNITHNIKLAYLVCV